MLIFYKSCTSIGSTSLFYKQSSPNTHPLPRGSHFPSVPLGDVLRPRHVTVFTAILILHRQIGTALSLAEELGP